MSEKYETNLDELLLDSIGVLLPNELVARHGELEYEITSSDKLKPSEMRITLNGGSCFKTFPTKEGLPISTRRINKRIYILSKLSFDPRTKKWTYRFLNFEGEWVLGNVSEEAVRRRMPKPLLDSYLHRHSN